MCSATWRRSRTAPHCEAPPGLAGLFLAALFGVLRPASTDRQRLRVAKATVAVCGFLCVIVATMLAHTNGTALSLWYTISAIPASLAFTAWATFSLNRGFRLHSYMIGVGLAVSRVLPDRCPTAFPE